MRVALVCPYDLDQAGGVRNQVVGLAGALAAAGDAVVVLGPGDPAHRAPLEVASGAVRLERLGTSRSLAANGSMAPLALGPSSVAALRRALLRFAPELCHVHEPFAPLLGPAAVLLARCPVLGTFHRAGADAIYRAARPVLAPLYARLGGAVAVSEAARATLVAVLGARAHGVAVVGNSVDAARVGASRRDAQRGRVLFFGRLEPRKGVADLIAAVRDCPAVRELRIVGDGPEAAALRAAAAGEARIAFSGRLDDAELAGELARAEVVVAPSRGGESFGVVLLEAMAAGVPVLASDLPGHREAAGEAAHFFPAGDPDALARSLAALLDDASRRAELARAGRERAAGASFTAQATSYRARYQELLAPGSRNVPAGS
ncbi:MAG: glycosyltransferase family 4 protein [Actinomycetota bacterium]|nr:glycosyltransferase family 4 protein [Actinomycetota bacterium]